MLLLIHYFDYLLFIFVLFVELFFCKIFLYNNFRNSSVRTAYDALTHFGFVTVMRIAWTKVMKKAVRSCIAPLTSSCAAMENSA